MGSKLIFTCILISLLVSCTNQDKGSESSNRIDIEGSLENTTKLNLSDFGKTIRYIPLETTDRCLVGNNPIVKVLKNHIVIEANNGCLLFDKKDGRFISTIGHIGQDPEAYSSAFSWADESENFLYFTRQPNQLMKYDMNGEFSGKIELSNPGLAAYYLLTDSEIVGYYNELGYSHNFCLALFDKEGGLQDTIPSLRHKLEESMNDVMNVSVIKGHDIYGIWTKTGAIIIDYKNDKRLIVAADAATLWKYNETIRFKETFVDTIYTVAGRELIPDIVFNTGKWHWPENERTSKSRTSERIFVSSVSESDTFIFFQCIKGLYSDEFILYNGLYNKKTGETKLGKNSDAIQDDLTNFMPFKPLAMSTSGEFVSLIEAGDIMDWIEEHPEAKNNDKLSFLKELNEDMNPVILLVE